MQWLQLQHISFVLRCPKPMCHFGRMANYQDEFRRIFDEEVGYYADRALGLLAQAIQAKGLLVLTAELLKSLRMEEVGVTAQAGADADRARDSRCGASPALTPTDWLGRGGYGAG